MPITAIQVSPSLLMVVLKSSSKNKEFLGGTLSRNPFRAFLSVTQLHRGNLIATSVKNTTPQCSVSGLLVLPHLSFTMGNSRKGEFSPCSGLVPVPCREVSPTIGKAPPPSLGWVLLPQERSHIPKTSLRFCCRHVVHSGCARPGQATRHLLASFPPEVWLQRPWLPSSRRGDAAPSSRVYESLLVWQLHWK